jgi:hypothetical protein
MKKISFYVLPLFAIMLLPHSAAAQKVGSTSMQFLKVMPCARATALGDAYSVWASGAEAAFWNPAGVASVQGNEVSLTYLKWIFDTQQGALAYATSFEQFGAVAAQLQFVDFGSFDEAIWSWPYTGNDQPGLTGRTFRPYAYLVGLTYANQLTDKFSTGVSIKYAHESLYDGGTIKAVTVRGDTIDANTWANGLVFDFGLQYNTGFRTVRLGAAMQNFGANVQYASEGNPVPMSLRVGAAADLLGNDALLFSSEVNRLSVAFDMFQPNDYAQQAHAGVEYSYSEVVALRAGYKFNYDADGFTAGLGLRQSIDGMTLSFDYSYGSLNYNLGNAHRISLGARF